MPRPILTILAELAAGQNGCVTGAQLRAAKISERRARSLRRRGAMRRVVPGVDLVGTATLTGPALARGATLRGGDGCGIGGRSGLEWRSGVRADLTRVTVWVPSSRRTRPCTVVTELPVHETGHPATIELLPSRALGRREVVRGIPVCGTADALVALAVGGTACERELRGAWDEADFLGLIDRDSIAEALDTLGQRGGDASLIARLLVDSPLVGANAKLLSRPERRLLAGLVRRGLEPPVVNGSPLIGGRTEYPDFFYPDEQLAVEADGGGHDRPSRQIKDVAREERLRALGIATLRFADLEIWHELERCLDEIDAKLQERRAHLQPDRAAAAAQLGCTVRPTA